MPSSGNAIATQTAYHPSSPSINRPPPAGRASAGRAALALGAMALASAILVLQAIALDKIRKSFGKTSTVQWGSPAFDSSSIAVLDGNCHLRTTNVAATKGIGLVDLPASHQEDCKPIDFAFIPSCPAGLVLIETEGLRRAFGILIASLVIEFVDCLILVFTDSRKLVFGLEIQRPWLTVSRPATRSTPPPAAFDVLSDDCLADVLWHQPSRRADYLRHHGMAPMHFPPWPFRLGQDQLLTPG